MVVVSGHLIEFVEGGHKHTLQGRFTAN
jgi:hypothetical protein